MELFLDLVLVFAMSQVTHLMLAELAWTGFGHGVLALTAVWWAWVCFTWLTKTTADSGVPGRTLTLAALAAMLVAAIALPGAFADDALVFGLAYLSVRVLHVVMLIRAIDGIDHPLTLLPAVALAGGVALAYTGDVADRWRDHHRLATDRLMTGAASDASSRSP